MTVTLEPCGPLTAHVAVIPATMRLDDPRPTAAGLREEIGRLVPELGDEIRRCALAVGDEILLPGDPIEDGVVVALLPPACGG